MQEQVTPEQAMQVALRHHKTGRLAEAEKIYRQILAVQPNHADSLHLLGVIAMQVGRHDAAIDWIRRAISILPSEPSFYSNLGEANRFLNRLDEAVAAHRHAIRLNPAVAEAHYNLGVALAAQGRLDDAIATYSRAIEIKPDYASAYFNLGNVRRDQGKLDQAAAAYREAIRAKPDNADALTNLGAALSEQGKLDEAITAFTRAIDINPALAGVYNNLGNALQRQKRLDEAATSYSNLGVVLTSNGKLDEAIAACRRAIATKPDLPEAHYNLGVALHDKGWLDEAIAAYRQTIVLSPNNSDAYGNLGVALKEKGELDEAIAAYRQAIAINPNYAEAYSNLGGVLNDKGQLDEAVRAYRQAIALRPNIAAIQSNLGAALTDMRRPDEAIAACRKAIALSPNLHEAYSNLGNALKDKAQFDDSIVAFNKAIALKPTSAKAHNNLGGSLKDTGHLEEAVAHYRRACELKPDYVVAHSNLLFALNFCPGYDAQSIFEEHRRWNQRHGAPFAKLIHSHDNDRSPDRRLRIGYVGADFRGHCQTQFTVPLLSNHDRAGFEVFCYSNVRAPDAVTAKMHAHFDTWRTIRGVSDDQAAEMIRQDRIDILIDLTLHMADNRMQVFARKPAPVQITWLGYPGTTGLDTIDYRLSDPYLDPFDPTQGRPFDAAQDGPPEQDKVYTEATLRLPETFWCYDPLSSDSVVSSLPALPNGFVTLGCLNNFCKINNGTLALWATVLRAVPTSRLLMLAPRGTARQRVLEFFRREEIDPVRIGFSDPLPTLQYRELYHRIDVSLDALPYNGHTSSLDSFWMGVPVVTLVGKTVVGRAGLSQLSNLGMTELVAWDAEQYVRIVQQLAGDLPKLAALRAGLRERMTKSPLMDAPRFARNMEAAYRQAWLRWCLGQTHTTR